METVICEYVVSPVASLQHCDTKRVLCEMNLKTEESELHLMLKNWMQASSVTAVLKTTHKAACLDVADGFFDDLFKTKYKPI